MLSPSSGKSTFKMNAGEDASKKPAEQARAALRPPTSKIALDTSHPPALLSQTQRVIQDLPAVRESTAREQAKVREKVVYGKEKLLSIVAKPGATLEEREASLVGRERDLEVAMQARWGANLQDLEMLQREKQRRAEWDQECQNERGDRVSRHVALAASLLLPSCRTINRI